MIKIYIASDHAGVELKSSLVTFLENPRSLSTIKREVIDLGPQSSESVDYPDYADKVCQKIHSLESLSLDGKYSYPREIGILICGSGQGMAMRANKYRQIRAALCDSPEIAQLSREHNDANVLCLGSRFLTSEEAFLIVDKFLSTSFSGGRHSQRVQKMSQET